MKGITMTKLRRMPIAVAGLLVAISGVLTAAPAAFAMRVVPPHGDSGSTIPTYIVTQAGLTGWQVALLALLALGAAVSAVALTVIVVSLRFRSHFKPLAG
jgi:hypothetical protein